MKKYLPIALAIGLLSFGIAQAATTVPWTRSGTKEYPSYVNDFIGIGSNNPLTPLWVHVGTNQNFMARTTGSNLQIGSLADDAFSYTPVALEGSKITLGVNSGGNVGIATSTPGYPLTVVGSENHRGTYYHFGDTTPLAQCDTVMGASTCLELVGNDNTVGGTGEYISNISTGTSAYSGLTLLNNAVSNATTNYSGLFLNGSNYNDATFGSANNVPSLLQVANAQGPVSIQSFGSTSASSYINFYAIPTTPGSGISSSSEVMRITSAGLAIGTTAPTSRLTVSASDAGTTLTSASLAMNSIINTNTTNNSFSDLGFGTADVSGNTAITSKIAGINTVHTGSATSGDLAFFTRNTGTLAEGMRISANGNVGIGTSTPGSKLTLGSGQIEAPVGSTGAPSYTFTDNKNTGMYFGTGALAFTTGGATRVNINATGLSMNNGTGPILQYQNSSLTLPTLAPAKTDLTSGLGGDGAKSIALITSSTPRLVVAPAGNVSVGTTTTGAGLNVGTNGAASSPSALVSGTVFSGGDGTTTLPLFLVQPTQATAAVSWNTNGTLIGANAPSGFSGLLLDLHNNGGASMMSLQTSGTLTVAGNVALATAGTVTYGSRSKLSSPADSQLLMTNQAATDFGRLELGGTTSSFPAIKRNGAGIDFRLADDSGYATTTASGGIFNSRVGIGSSTPAGTALTTNGTNYMTGLTTSSALQSGIACFDAAGQVINESVACVASAARYKTNVASTTFSLDGLMKLRPVSFDWKKDYLGGKTDPNLTGTQYSLIADDVQKVFPQLVAVTSATTTFEGKTYAPGSVQGLEDTNHWLSAIVSWLQQIIHRQDKQQKQIDAQQKQIDALTAQVKALMKK